MPSMELQKLFEIWNAEAARTVRVLEAIPRDAYDFRPDAGGRSIGEMAWHLAEGDAYNSVGVAEGSFSRNMRPPGIDRPKEVAALAPGYARIQREAVERIKGVSEEQLETPIQFWSGDKMRGMDVLWGAIYHNIHHRGQLSLMIRLAGGVAPGVYGPNREEMAAMAGQA
jgi:uncharacterized damage-inducible protein DinB